MDDINRRNFMKGIASLATLALIPACSNGDDPKTPISDTPDKNGQNLEQLVQSELTIPTERSETPVKKNPVFDTNEYLLWNKPSIGPATINKVLARHNSPSRNLGEDLYDTCFEMGADPAFILAMYGHESSFGKAGVAKKTKAWGNVRPGSSWEGPTVNGSIGKFRAYETHKEGMKDMLDVLHTFYTHLDTPTQVINKYAPASENNVAEYVKQIKQSMNHFRDLERRNINYAFTKEGVIQFNKEDFEEWRTGHLYVIESGDLPHTIAKKHNTTWQAIENYNKQKNHPADARKLKPRRTLYIPKSE